MTLTKLPAVMLAGGGSGAASGFVNPESYGLKAVGVSGADPALNKIALESALAAGPVLLPSKTYQVTGINFTGKIVLIGCGFDSRLVVTGSGAGIHIAIPAGNVGTILRDFAIEPSVSGGGTYGIHFEQTHANGYMANWEISGISMDLSKPWGSISINLDNHIAAADGFFTGVIEKCVMTTGPNGGIVGDHIGDSIIIRKNVVSGGLGVSINCIQVAGARQLVIQDNNLTSRNGQIYLEACGQATVRNNWCEHPAYMGEFVGAPIVLAEITLASCYMCDLTYNTISGGSGQSGPGGSPIGGASYGVRLTGTTQISIIGPRNWIYAVGISYINDISTSGTNSAISTGTGANILA
ncbi:hypothetical protein [Rhizobium ruizarguesonis]|uniref:hypothetical protein n=1 Tax=Rhizobium ruizarguesonis TaxID=2081791 RepID=UPI001031EB23|nr:hypothetical protein [Rhizobium ruizarguesonis]TBA57905.1 hypothetical protein ELH59_07625 [Rhizobium ruizarguesonis]